MQFCLECDEKYQADRIRNSVRTDAGMPITIDRIKTVRT